MTNMTYDISRALVSRAQRERCFPQVESQAIVNTTARIDGAVFTALPSLRPHRRIRVIMILISYL